MLIDIITLFPEMFAGVFGESIIKRAVDKNILELRFTQLRDFAFDKHRQVDDSPFGGGAGMVLKPEPVYRAVRDVLAKSDENFSRKVIITDPMLATGGSAIDAIDQIKKRGATDITMVSLVGAPEGVRALQAKHPDVDLYLAALDEGLNEIGYIVPGLGDAGDRLFGTD